MHQQISCKSHLLYVYDFAKLFMKSSYIKVCYSYHGLITRAIVVYSCPTKIKHKQYLPKNQHRCLHGSFSSKRAKMKSQIIQLLDKNTSSN